ncbi:outer membrane beta-barrel protein [Brevundimonas sp.]|uniref:outer membrane protein n=1 Tax=Brevundimonas sp. TaxID=1871086 RepID=UPI0025D59FBE|nr:outer membrane beta-barrel protein [Brevundimonas sp.]
MRLLYLGATALALAASPALAQSGPWSGPYVAGFAGYADADNEDRETFLFDTDQDGAYDDTVLTSGGANAFSPGFCDGLATSPTPAGGCAEDSDGGDFGVRLGYDWQSGAFVYGLLAEVSSAEVDDSVSAFSTTPARYAMTREVDYITAIRGRFGYAWGRVMAYGTAGLAYGEVSRDFTTSNGANSFTERDDDAVMGVQIGAGAEFAVNDRVSLGLEYLRTSLEDGDYTVRAGPGTAPPTNPFLIVNPTGTDMRRSDTRFDISSWRLTATYRF